MLIRNTHPETTSKRKSLDEVRSDAVFRNLVSILETDPAFKVGLNFLDRNPEQMFFKIGDASKAVGVKTYILRYWEGEFKRYLRPLKTRSQQRIYRKKDVLYALLIKNLVYERGFTLEGAKKKLSSLVSCAEVEWQQSIAPTILDDVVIRLDQLTVWVDEYEFDPDTKRDPAFS